MHQLVFACPGLASYNRCISGFHEDELDKGTPTSTSYSLLVDSVILYRGKFVRPFLNLLLLGWRFAVVVAHLSLGQAGSHLHREVAF